MFGDWNLLGKIAFVVLAAAIPWLLHRAKRLREGLRVRYVRRGKQLAHAMRLVRLAEELAQLGHWEFDAQSRRQDWSVGLYALFGLDGPGELCPGDAEMLLAGGGDELFRNIAENRECRDTFAFDFGAMRVDGEQRTLRMHARNRFARSGRVRRVYGVVMDVTDQIRREKALRESEREAREREEEARRMAETDPLTGLANRRRVMDWLDKAIAASKSGDGPLSVILMDIDHFKRVNDTHGHQAGDEVLRKIAAIARESSRQEDLVGRMGGEEFVIGLRNAGRPIAFAAAERLRRRIAQESATGKVPAVTVSMGYATLEPGDTTLKLFARADAALYAAKDGGRNQVKRAA